MCIFWFLLHRYITVHRSKNVKCVTTLYFWIHFRQPFCVRFLHGAAYFRQLLVPWIISTGSGAHPASCTVGTGSLPGVKSGRGVTLIPHPLLVPWWWKGRAIPLLPVWAVRPVQNLSACTRVHFTFTFYTQSICFVSNISVVAQRQLVWILY